MPLLSAAPWAQARGNKHDLNKDGTLTNARYTTTYSTLPGGRSSTLNLTLFLVSAAVAATHAPWPGVVHRQLRLRLLHVLLPGGCPRVPLPGASMLISQMGPCSHSKWVAQRAPAAAMDWRGHGPTVGGEPQGW